MGDPRAWELAASQNGVVASWQLRAAGLTRQQIYRLRRSPTWEPIHDTVLRHAAAPAGRAQAVTAEVLSVGGGAFLSHESAAAWWGHRGCRLSQPVQVTSPRGRTPLTEYAQVFHMRDPDRRWVTQLGGVQVARPELVALQLFDAMSFGRAERVVDRLWSLRLLTGRSVALLLRDLGRRGRNGTAGLRVYLDARGTDYRPPDSGLESRVEQILGQAGIGVRRQVDLGGEQDWSGRVDFLHESLPLVIEVQSELYHSSLTDVEADGRRIECLRGDGFRVVEVTDEQVWTAPAAVVRAVQAEIAAHCHQNRDNGRRFGADCGGLVGQNGRHG